MEFAFSEDQLAITEAARGMLLDSCTAADLRKLSEAGKDFDASRWNTIVEMGLLGMLVPEAKGGLGMGLVDLIGIAEAAGYVALPEPLVEMAGIVLPLLAAVRDDKGYLEQAIGGTAIALQHPSSPYVTGLDTAAALLAQNGDNLYLIARGSVLTERKESFDPLRHLDAVQWNATNATRLGAAPADIADRGALLAAAQMIGLAQRCIDLAVAYAKDRVQFGKPIGSTQAVKHMISSAQVKVEFARPVVHAAAAELPLGTLAGRARVAHAKIAAGEAADAAARMAVQAHGAMGMTWEVDLHFFLKRAFALNHVWGSPADHRRTVIERIGAERTGPDATFASELIQAA
jgi:alkylation response protein AidB-like acyl-CoA dehydrogenase